MMLARRSARPLTTLKTPNAVPCNSTGAVSFTQVLLAKLVSAGSPLLAFLGAFTPYDIVDEADSEEIARLHAHYVQSQEGAAKVSVARGDVSYTFAIMLIFERHARLKNLSRKQEKTTAYLPGAGLEPARTLPGPRDFKNHQLITHQDLPSANHRQTTHQQPQCAALTPLNYRWFIHTDIHSPVKPQSV